VFPSIDWTPKAHRIAAIIEAIQLRPQTVMFIDDSPSNRAEAAATVPGLQLADPSFISEILADPQFSGKNDAQLTRLAQYKLLEKRAQDQARSGADVIQFLRASNIRVTIEVDLEKHIGRAVELVNRTNQLNFTKKRLPEDTESAARVLLDEVRSFDMQAGLVRVTDNYGDHGFCGFYVKSGLNSREHLVHYCFSCRILGMGVEKWLYDKFARPKLDVVGEVITDLFDDTDVDWINVSGFSTKNNALPRQRQMIPEIRLRGGCELAALAHYFSLDTPKILVETAHGKDGMFVRIDTTANMMPAIRNRTTALREEILKIGLSEAEFASNFLVPSVPGTILILSTWGDVWAPLYKHKKMDFQFGYSITHLGGSDLTDISDRTLTQYFADYDVDGGLRLRMQSRVQHLHENYDYGRGLKEETLRENLKEVFDQIPLGCRLFFILPYRYRANGSNLLEIPGVDKYNRAVTEVAANYQSIELLSMDEFVHDASEALENAGHFDRIVYFRIYEKLSQMISEQNIQHIEFGNMVV
jgi:FkbH-like protein